ALTCRPGQHPYDAHAQARHSRRLRAARRHYGLHSGLLADTAVDALPQQIGVAAVPRILLDHVYQHVTKLYLSTMDGSAQAPATTSWRVVRSGSPAAWRRGRRT